MRQVGVGKRVLSALRKIITRRKAVFSRWPGTGDGVVAGAGEAAEGLSPGDMPRLWGDTAAGVSLSHAVHPWLI